MVRVAPLGKLPLNAGLRPIDGKRQDVRDLSRSRRQHYQAIHTERHAGTFGEAVLEGSQEVFVDRHFWEIGLAPLVEIFLETPPLNGRVGEFVVAVGEFDPLDKDLEAFCNRWVALPDLRKRCLRSGVVVNECGLAVTEF